MLKKNFNMENGSPLRSENLEQFNEDRSTWLNQVYDIYNSPSYSDEHKVMADVHAYFQIASAVSVYKFLSSTRMALTCPSNS